MIVLTTRRATARRLPFVAYVICCVLGIGVVAGKGWSEGWETLHLHAITPSFIDMRSIQAGITAKKQGVDPQVSNPGDALGRTVNYPAVWVTIGRVFSLDNERCFLAFCITTVIACMVACGWLLWCFPSWWLFLAAISHASLWAIETSNNDIHMLLLVLAFGLLDSWWMVLPFAAAVLLKIYPVFALSLPIVRRQAQRSVALASVAALALASLLPQLAAIRGGNTATGTGSYGWRSFYGFVSKICAAAGLGGSATAIVLALVAAGVVGALVFRARSIEPVDDSREGRLYLVGAGIYVGTFLLATNWDYRLIFLVLCMPWLTVPARNRDGKILRVLIVLAMTSISFFGFGLTFRLVGQVAKVGIFVLLTRSLAATLLARRSR